MFYWKYDKATLTDPDIILFNYQLFLVHPSRYCPWPGTHGHSLLGREGQICGKQLAQGR